MSYALIELVSRDKDCDSGNPHRAAGDTSLPPKELFPEQIGRKPQTMQERVQVEE